jgi:hypothetical protein
MLRGVKARLSRRLTAQERCENGRKLTGPLEPREVARAGDGLEHRMGLEASAGTGLIAVIARSRQPSLDGP